MQLKAQLAREQRKAETTAAALERRLATLQLRADREAKAAATAEARVAAIGEEQRRLHMQLAVAVEASESATRSATQATTTVRAPMSVCRVAWPN